MATPVVTDQWAGNFDCSECRRKRLMAEDFSKKALERHRKDESAPLRCKKCVAAAQEKEQKQAAASAIDTSETRVCAACKEDKSASAYNRNQWNKPEGKGRCRSCVEASNANEANASAQSKKDAIEKAQAEVAKARESKNPVAILKAESVLSALQAERVTGLKPVKMNAGRGRGGRGRGRGRGGGRRR